MRRRGRRYKQLLDDVKEIKSILGVKRGSTRLHSPEMLTLEEAMEML